MAITTINIGTPSGLTEYINTDIDEIKAGVTAASTVIYLLDIDNSDNGSPVFLGLYNLAVGNVTVGTTDRTSLIEVPASTRLVIPFPQGWTFGTGLTLVCTLNDGDDDATDPGASDVTVRVLYV